jgi:predicted RNase H-like HicB family nuclease
LGERVPYESFIVNKDIRVIVILIPMKSPFSCSLPVTIFREGKAFVAYTPALDLSSAGKTEAQARRMFTEAIEAFFEELIEMGTVESVLKELGWTKVLGARF